MAAYELIKRYKLELMFHYDLEGKFEDEEKFLEAIALKLNRRMPGGALDTETAAKMLLQDWQKGKIQL
jgi:ribosome biogenesis GTPase A